MPDRFHESDTENAPECGCLHRVLPNSGAERIGFIWSRVNKIPIRYETESDTLVIRYRVNGAFICSVHLRQVFNGTHQLRIELNITIEILKILKNKALVLIFLVISWQFCELNHSYAILDARTNLEIRMY